MNFSRKRSLSQFPYTLSTSSLSVCSSYKYLAVHFTSNLSWVTHINSVTADASRTLGYIKRNLKSAPNHLRKLAYETYVRPKLEYAAAIWSPHQKYLTTHIEKVQTRAARFITSSYSYSMSVSLLKHQCSLPLLEVRRTIFTLCLIHKFYYSNRFSSVTFLKPPNRSSHRTTNSKSFQHLTGSTNAFINSVVPRGIRAWNDLPESIVTIAETTLFRAKLESYFLSNAFPLNSVSV